MHPPQFLQKVVAEKLYFHAAYNVAFPQYSDQETIVFLGLELIFCCCIVTFLLCLVVRPCLIPQ